jgi:hypothetical protein
MVFCTFATSAHAAATTYDYTGQPFTNFSTFTDGLTSIQGSFTTSSALAGSLPIDTNIAGQVTAYSFTDGTNGDTFTLANSSITDFELSTNAAGVPNSWYIYLTQTTALAPNVIVIADNPSGTPLVIGDGAIMLNGAGNEASAYTFNPSNPSGGGATGNFTPQVIIVPPSSVPEPESITLLATGLLGLIITRRKAIQA